MKRVKLTKVAELSNAAHPNNISVGHVVEGEALNMPRLGHRFNVKHDGHMMFSSSPVQKIHADGSFDTTSSTYKVEELKEEALNIGGSTHEGAEGHDEL